VYLMLIMVMKAAYIRWAQEFTDENKHDLTCIVHVGVFLPWRDHIFAHNRKGLPNLVDTAETWCSLEVMEPPLVYIGGTGEPCSACEKI
jgi:hypothetical protein